jgi:hypothetical protein
MPVFRASYLGCYYPLRVSVYSLFPVSFKHGVRGVPVMEAAINPKDGATDSRQTHRKQPTNHYELCLGHLSIANHILEVTLQQ